MTRRRSKRCRHVDTDVCYVPVLPHYVMHIDVCNDCDELLPLGPANDGCPLDDQETYEAVAIERHAAALIADAESGVTTCTDLWQTAIGVIEHDTGADPPIGILASLWHAGWLARHVYTHKEAP